MDLNDYFDPVSINKPQQKFLKRNCIFGRNITVHTANSPIGNLQNFDLALIGIPEDRNSSNKGCCKAPDRIRSKLYELYKTPKKIRIIDLGNLKIGDTINDTYFGVRDIIIELLTKSVFPLIIGGTQDLTYANFLAIGEHLNYANLVTVDSKIDLINHTDRFDSQTYLGKIIFENNIPVNYANIGHQVCLVDQKDIDRLKKAFYEIYRLGIIRTNLKETEPVLRDANVISIDIASIKQADAPGQCNPSPNGFYADEICQISKYAGLSDNMVSFGLYEVNPVLDKENQTTHLAAQMIWYFIDGFSQKIAEQPSSNSNEFTQYIIHLSEVNQELVFYKSLKTNRWWIKSPYINENIPYPKHIACSYNDYLKASNQEIPDRWWKAFQKFN
jgi:formiminoglutamase